MAGAGAGGRAEPGRELGLNPEPGPRPRSDPKLDWELLISGARSGYDMIWGQAGSFTSRRERIAPVLAQPVSQPILAQCTLSQKFDRDFSS